MKSSSVTVVILTFNEQQNLPECLSSLQAINCEILVVDSYSTDRTLEILKKEQIRFLQHEFVNYSLQRNWSQGQIQSDWVLHIDADERLTPEFCSWFMLKFPKLSQHYDGFLFSRKTVFMNRWIKHGGHYPNFHLRLFKKKKVICEEKAYDQHFVGISGSSFMTVENADIVNNVSENLTAFINKHNRWASLEASEMVEAETCNATLVNAKFFGTPIEKRRWLKSKLFMRLPLFIRPFAYFLYRYFFRLGFLDGVAGLIFHFLQGFWFRFLIDAKVYELQQSLQERNLARR